MHRVARSALAMCLRQPSVFAPRAALRRSLATEATQAWSKDEQKAFIREHGVAAFVERVLEERVVDPETLAQSQTSSPVEALVDTYERTLAVLASGAFPETSVYRQSVETITRRKLEAVRTAGTEVAKVETVLRALGEIGIGGLTANEGIEGALDTASDELRTAESMAQWRAFEPLEEPAPERQWEYFK